MKSKSRGQASLEYIGIVGIVLVLLIPLFFYAVNKSSENIKLNQASDTVNTIAKAADEVYTLGPETKKFVWINIPGGVSSTTISINEVTLSLGKQNFVSDINAFTTAPMIGSFPKDKGTYKISIMHLESGVVLVGDGNDTTDLQITFLAPSGLTCNPVTLKATTNEPARCKYDTSDTDYDSMTSSMVGNALGHTYSLGVLNDGNFSYYVRCMDSFNNKMNSSDLISFNVNLTYCGTGDGSGNLTIESNPPVVTLISPNEGYVSNSSRNDYAYNVTDQASILLCSFIANGTVINSVITPSKDVTNNISGDLDIGNYDWQINCTDAFGNIGNSSSRGIEINATLDSDLPVINVVSPANNTVRNFNLIKFFYNVSDATSGVDSCTLSVGGILDTGGSSSFAVTDSSIVEDTEEVFTVTLSQGNHTWNISCEDDSIYQNSDISQSYMIRVNSTTEEAFITSCAGRCGFDGYGDGICRQSEPKCDQNGEDHNTDGDVFCTGGAQSDTCCCVP
jgi:uncharacterized protein (UPF0333 family)